MKFLGLFIATCLYLMADALEEKTIDELMVEATNDSMSFDLVSSGSAENPTVRVEHDIMMTLEDYMQQEKERMAENKMSRRKKRKAIRSEQRRWPNKIVPYEIEPNTFSMTDLNQMNLAISDWNRNTCVVFRQRNGEARAVRFQNGQGCSSFVGTIGNVQPISLARGCRIRRIVVHEMGHAVGFQHEQSRPDRDGFVRIRTESIPKPVLFNFNRLPMSRVNNFEVPYDYRSVMHYGARDFSTNGQITVQTIDSRFQNIIGRAPGLSFNDIKLANIMYNCAENCPAMSCPGEGFVGKDCSCKCPTNNPNNPVQNCSGTTLVTTTSVSSSTIRTTIPTEGACEDMNRFCDYWAEQGYCNRSRFVEMYCKAACNLCNAQKRCEDIGQSCGLLRDRGFCQLQFVRSYMESNCAASCNFCRAGELLSADGTPLNQPEIENAAQKDSMSVITIAYIITVPGIIIICIGVNVVTYKCGVKKGRRIERKHKLQEFQEETQTVHYQHYQTDTENPEAIPLAQQGPSAGQRSVDPSHDYAAYDEIKDQRQRMQESQKRKEGGYLTPVSQGQSRALPPVRTNGDGYVSPKTTAKKSQEEVGKTSKGDSPSPPGDGGYISPLQQEKDASEKSGSGNSDSSSNKSDKSDKSRKYQNDPQSKSSPKTKALYESLKDTGVTQEHDYIELQT